MAETIREAGHESWYKPWWLSQTCRGTVKEQRISVSQGAPRAYMHTVWECEHEHRSTDAATKCAEAELRRMERAA